MSDIVIVSSWRREDYLTKCFDGLLNARGINDKEVWVFQNCRKDIGIDLNPVYDCLSRYSHKFENFRLIQKESSSWMDSHTYAWQRAYAADSQYVYFFSDDVICTPDFFEWHDAVQATGDWFGSTAWRHPQGNTKPFDLEAFYQVTYPTEISMGLCVKHSSIPKLLAAAPDWSKVQEPIVMPYVPRCYHIGGFSSHLESVGENTGPAVDVLPNPIPDYGRQKVVLK